MRFWRSLRAGSSVRRLRRLGTDRYWSSRSRRRWVHLGWSRLLSSLRDRLAQFIQDGGLFAQLVIQAVPTGLVTLLLLLGLEAVAAVLNGHHVGWAHALDGHVAPERYEAFIATAVGAQGTFLALFFTTVGVIASTAYANVPGEVRQLFVHERGSRLYITNVVGALVFGVAILSMRLIDHQPHVLTVLSLSLLTVFSVLSLAALGTGLFNFFDLSSLATPLPGRLRRAVGAVTAGRSSLPSEAVQQASHERAAAVLSVYGQLTTLLSQRAGGEVRAPLRLARQLLEVWLQYAARKPAIPTASHWFARVPSHQNWLTADHDRLTMALTTSTGLSAELIADPLWLERELARHLSGLLPLLVAPGSWGVAIGVVDRANQTIEFLASRLQVEEALLLRAAMVAQLGVAESKVPAEAEAEAPSLSVAAATGRTFRLAAAERSVLTLTSAWLGVVRAAEWIADSERVSRGFEAAVSGPTAPYRAGAPSELLSVLELIAAGIAFERRTEGQRITPLWWISHVAARALSRQLQSVVARLLAEVDRGVVAPLEAAQGADPELAVVQLFPALELVAKIVDHLPTVQRALDALETFRHPAAADDGWAPPNLATGEPTVLEGRLLRRLGRVIMDLPAKTYDSTKPDVFGRAYKVLFDGTFVAILEGHDELSGDLFPVLMTAVERASRRLVGDLAQALPLLRHVFSTEPVIDLMEISGCALLMSELDGRGIWAQVRALWDTILARDTGPALVKHLMTVLAARATIFAVTQGALARTERRFRLERLLRGRGIHGHEDSGRFRRDRRPAHASPVVTAFAPGWLGHHELEDLFVAEYLLGRPEVDGLPIPNGVRDLRDQLDLERRRVAGARVVDEGFGE
jgi:hypothetical protein